MQMAIPENTCPEKTQLLRYRKVVCPANQGRISYAQAVKSTASPAPVVSEILPAVTQFIERYFSEMYTEPEINKDSAAETGTQTVLKDSVDGPVNRSLLRLP